ncbi:MAG: NfeD family protein [Desulfohalobiaceae bacterium]|nr:NfeD family protein [Desulfohalobiaceae bacterium]
MIRKGWTRKAVLKYMLLEIPQAVLFAFFLWLIRIRTGLPLWFLFCLLGMWLAKDVVLFFYTWPAYDENTGERFSMLGLAGVATEPLDPQGYILIRGERWRARPAPGHSPIAAGKTVRVLEQKGLTLIVREEE